MSIRPQTFLLIGCSWLAASPNLPSQASHREPTVIMAISRNTALLQALTVTPRILTRERVVTGLVGFLSPDGVLRDPQCSSDDQTNCKLIQQTLLSQPLSYAGISSGSRLRVTSAPTTMDECFSTSASGRMNGGDIATAVVSSDPALFAPVQPKLAVGKLDRAVINVRVTQMIRASSEDLLVPRTSRVEKFRLARIGHIYLVAEGRTDTKKGYAMFFGIWSVSGGTYSLVASNEFGFQEPENFIGTIHIKEAESDLIVTSASDSEGYHFNVYGLRDGLFHRVYRGGGATC